MGPLWQPSGLWCSPGIPFQPSCCVLLASVSEVCHGPKKQAFGHTYSFSGLQPFVCSWPISCNPRFLQCFKMLCVVQQYLLSHCGNVMMPEQRESVSRNFNLSMRTCFSVSLCFSTRFVASSNSIDQSEKYFNF